MGFGVDDWMGAGGSGSLLIACLIVSFFVSCFGAGRVGIVPGA